MSNVPISAAVRSLSEERTREWLEAQSAPDEDEVESIAESSVVDSLDYEYSEYTQDEDDEDNENTGEEISTMPLGTSITNKRSKISDTLRDLMNSINSIQTVGNVNISNSTNVHIGNVTNINGNIQIIANSLSRARHDRRKTSLTEVPAPDIEPNLLSKDESEERVCSDSSKYQRSCVPLFPDIPGWPKAPWRSQKYYSVPLNMWSFYTRQPRVPRSAP
ncbi:peptidoglycan-recognition protein LE isoform X2 [Drosophila persimilis]|uniref:peptidoglycan-recognition protein LE isoform X2 n=1 Tax=Drosophila persimilis TaxID=7234 RepID=UPI000F08B4AB|nr:peptidoglycan-recognition protein LE isoform X2 [Drosophila persimilis]